MPRIAPPAGCDLVLTADGIVGGVHFFPDDPPDTVARKALRVNLSDLAAKGARPLGFLLTLALPKEIGDAWLAPFARGLGADAELVRLPAARRRHRAHARADRDLDCGVRRGAARQDGAPRRRQRRATAWW